MRWSSLVLVFALFGFGPMVARGDKPVDAKASSAAAYALDRALREEGVSLSKVADQPFASVPLTSADAARVRAQLWDAHVQTIKKERAEELKKKELQEGDLKMPFFTKTFGNKPQKGHSLWISMHGGGGAPAAVNDRQYENQKKLYQLEEGIYLAPDHGEPDIGFFEAGGVDGVLEDILFRLGCIADEPAAVQALGVLLAGAGEVPILVPDFDPGVVAALIEPFWLEVYP